MESLLSSIFLKSGYKRELSKEVKKKKHTHTVYSYLNPIPENNKIHLVWVLREFLYSKSFQVIIMYTPRKKSLSYISLDIQNPILQKVTCIYKVIQKYYKRKRRRNRKRREENDNNRKRDSCLNFDLPHMQITILILASSLGLFYKAVGNNLIFIISFVLSQAVSLRWKGWGEITVSNVTGAQ